MFDFATPIDRHGTGARNGTMSPTGLAPPICCRSLFPIWISPPRPVFSTPLASGWPTGVRLQPLAQRGVLGRLPTGTPAALTATSIRNLWSTDPRLSMVAETIRQWSKEGDGVVVHTPAYDAFYNTITANRRRIAPVPLILKDNRWRCDMDRRRRRSRSQRIPCCCCAARTTQRGKSGVARSWRPWRPCVKTWRQGD